MNLLSADHLLNILGIKEPSNVTAVPTSVIVGAPDNGKPVAPFTPVEGPIFGFHDLESNDLFGTYVVIDNVETEVLVEIKSFLRPDGIDRRWAGEQMDSGEVELGHCFSLRGIYVNLSPEERDRIETDFIEAMNK